MEAEASVKVPGNNSHLTETVSFGHVFLLVLIIVHELAELQSTSKQRYLQNFGAE